MGFSSVIGRTVSQSGTSGKGGAYNAPQYQTPSSYSDVSYGPNYSYQSPYGSSSFNRVNQQYGPVFSAPQNVQSQFVQQQLPSGATTFAPSYASTYGSRPLPYKPISYELPTPKPAPRNVIPKDNVFVPEFQSRPKNIFPYPSNLQDTFAGNEQYQALMDYQKSLAPTEEQRTRLQELRSAFEGSDAYRDYQQERMRNMSGGIGGYRGMYGPRINREFGGFRPYMMPQYGYDYY